MDSAETVPRLRFGVLSDVHVARPGTEDLLEKAFAYYRDRQVNAVLLAGDIADWGVKEQLNRAAAAWFKVFPDDKLPDGRPVERLFVYGNHDYEGWRYGYLKSLPPETVAPDKVVATDPAAAWKEAWKEDFAPVMLKEVCGFPFVLCQTMELRRESWEPFLAQHGERLKQTPLFFYTQHFHPKGTCSAPWTWGQDSGYSTSALSQFPNCVSFTGHSHSPLTDERTIRQGDFGFTSVGTASLRYQIAFGGRENAAPFGAKVDTSAKQLPNIFREAYKSHHGQLVSVYDDRVVFERLDIETGEKLGADWVMPRDDYGALSYERRRKSAPVPQFAADARPNVYEGEYKNFQDQKVRQVRVAFPTVTAPVRAFDYEVTVRYRESDLEKVAIQKRVYSYALYKPVSQEPAKTVCAFAREELPWDVQLRFEVRPLNCFGVGGEPIEIVHTVESDEARKAKAKKAAKAKQKAQK